MDEDSAELVGTVDASSIVVKDENQQAHLGSPDFFGVERYPEITYRSASIRRRGDGLIVDGELTIKGHARAVEGRGTIEGPATNTHGGVNLGITLETVIDRTEFGLNVNMPLPNGGVAIANDVKLTIELELVHRGRLLVFDIDEIDAVAERLAEVLSPAPANVGLVDAQALAEQLGVARDWVYANADRLGGVRLGDGPRARLRFDAERAREALTANAGDGQATHVAASRPRRGRPPRKTVAAVPLIQGRSSR